MNNKPTADNSSSNILRRALNGEVTAQLQLATELESKHQLELAAAWYKSAALQGHADAAYRVGKICLQGDAAKRAEAFFWFHKAAIQAHDGAEYHISLLYETGIGVDKSQEQSLRWLRLAVQHGNKEALDKLRITNRNLDQVRPDRADNRNSSLA